MDNLPVYWSLDDVLLLPNHSKIDSRSEVDLSWKLGKLKFRLPIISINMDDVTGVEMAVRMGELGGLSLLPRFDEAKVQAEEVRQVKKKKVVVGAALGIKESEKERLSLLVRAGVDHVSIDVAHGHMQKVLDFVAYIKNKYPRISLSAGVVGTYEGAKDLFLAGADVVRVGVGPGTICTTRIMTGCGVPQFSAIREASRAAREMKKEIWADGGTKNSGDIVKCLAAGASAVIVGSQLAGTDEAPGKKVEKDGKWYKEYNASTSLSEKKEQIEKNSSDKTEHYVKHVEGVESLVPYKGPVAEVLTRIEAGVRSGLSYCGARTIEEVWEKARFVQVTALGIKENGAHDVVTFS